MNRSAIFGCIVMTMLMGSPCGAADEAAIRAAVAKSLPLLESSSVTAMAERPNCFTCHHAGLPLMTLVSAQERGFSVDQDNFRSLTEFTAHFLEKNHDNYLAGKGQGGQAFTAGSALCALEQGGWKPDATTEAVTDYLLGFQKDLMHWKPQSVRPPSEESHFSTTFVVLQGLKKYGTPAQSGRIASRHDEALNWLLKTPAKNTEDRVFRLWSLQAAGAGTEVIQEAARELLRSQRDDGGWSQLDDMNSDAYATGTALVALHRAAGLSATDASYQRGMQWLISDQLPDGSWHVRTRSKPVQSYFESGYPHGKDQFISITAACWATTALTLALPAAK